jgi:hypothetical protein
MSDPVGYAGRMKNRIMQWLGPAERVIVRFGEARLVDKENGMVELRGGTASDRTAAKEWVSLFMQEAVLTFTRR